MENKLIMSVLAIAVGVIVVGAVLVPIINDASDAQHEYYNNSVGQYSKAVDEEVTLSYVADRDTYSFVYSVNGVPVTTLPAYNDILIATSGLMFKVIKLSNDLSSYVIWWDSESGSRRIDSPVGVTAIMDKDSITVTIDKVTGGSETVTVDIDWGFYAVTEGDYRAVWDGYNVFVNDVNQIYSVSWATLSNEFYSIHGSDVFYDGQSITATYDLNTVSGVVDVYNLQAGGLTFSADVGGEPMTITPINVIVPAEIVGDKASYSDSASSLFKVIPVVVILALLLLVIPLMRRD